MEMKDKFRFYHGFRYIAAPHFYRQLRIEITVSAACRIGIWLENSYLVLGFVNPVSVPFGCLSALHLPPRWPI